MSDFKKKGRPKLSESREVLKMVSFRADEETRAALRVLLERSEVKATVGEPKGDRRSAVIRRAIKDAAKQRW